MLPRRHRSAIQEGLCCWALRALRTRVTFPAGQEPLCECPTPTQLLGSLKAASSSLPASGEGERWSLFLLGMP